MTCVLARAAGARGGLPQARAVTHARAASAMQLDGATLCQIGSLGVGGEECAEWVELLGALHVRRLPSHHPCLPITSSLPPRRRRCVDAQRRASRSPPDRAGRGAL